MDIIVHALIEALPSLFRTLSLQGFDPALPGLLLGALGGWYITGALDERRLKKQKVRREDRADKR